MSEVKEHSVIYLAPACHEDHMQREWCEDDVWSACEECGSENTSVRYNLGTDFDRVTAERDAALDTVALKDRDALEAQAAVTGWARKYDALQQRLTAADELGDVLETALRKIKLRLDAYQEADMLMPKSSHEFCQTIASAALRPAEGGGDEA